jgi:hypothetical protein
MKTSTVAPALENLISSLKTCRQQLKAPDTATDIKLALHSESNLPNTHVIALVSEALNVLRDIQLSLEPAQSVLADHFLGRLLMSADVKQSTELTIIRVYQHEMPRCGSGA